MCGTRLQLSMRYPGRAPPPAPWAHGCWANQLHSIATRPTPSAAWLTDAHTRTRSCLWVVYWMARWSASTMAGSSTARRARSPTSPSCCPTSKPLLKPRPSPTPALRSTISFGCGQVMLIRLTRVSSRATPSGWTSGCVSGGRRQRCPSITHCGARISWTSLTRHSHTTASSPVGRTASLSVMRRRPPRQDFSLTPSGPPR
mmetsp:Transcript_20164/g.48937  ORF Transcript_20164/g.48937 Transcript_20164/m.48937 type:complete len:201 (-) Transcript_20164:72-674(-)